MMPRARAWLLLLLLVPALAGAMQISYAPPIRAALMSLSANQLIPDNGANTNYVQFDTVEWDNAGLYTGTPGKLYVPAGYHWLRAVGNICWDINATGYRREEIEINGGAFMPSAHIVQPATAAGEGTCMNLSRGWTPVSPGDYVILYVKQNSGGGLNVVSTAFTWFYVEVAP